MHAVNSGNTAGKRLSPSPSYLNLEWASLLQVNAPACTRRRDYTHSQAPPRPLVAQTANSTPVLTKNGSAAVALHGSSRSFVGATTETTGEPMAMLLHALLCICSFVSPEQDRQVDETVARRK
jgi:hypothetical protein